jgi:hypothetical protein
MSAASKVLKYGVRNISLPHIPSCHSASLVLSLKLAFFTAMSKMIALGEVSVLQVKKERQVVHSLQSTQMEQPPAKFPPSEPSWHHRGPDGAGNRQENGETHGGFPSPEFSLWIQ